MPARPIRHHLSRRLFVTALFAVATVVGAASVAITAAAPAGATPVPFSQAVSQYAPAGLHIEAADPLSVTVGGSAVVFAPSATAGVYSGQVGSVAVTVTFTWHAAAQAITWDIALANSAVGASPGIVVTPLSLRLDADLANNVVPCAKFYNGSSYGFSGNLRSFDTTSVPAVSISGTETGSTSSVLQVAMNTKSATSPTSCSEQQRSNLAGLYTGLDWSAGWALSAGWGTGSTPPFLVSGGTDQATSAAPLALAGLENISYPTVNLGFVTGATWNDIENADVNFVRTVLQPTLPGQVTDSPVSYDSYFGVDGYPPLAFLEQQARRAAALGVKYFTVDAGWYQRDNSGDQFPGLGNSLTPSISLYPQGQDSLADFCKNFVTSLGMTCGIWLVPQANSSPNVDEVQLDPNKASDFATDVGYGSTKLQLQLPTAQDWAVSFLNSVINAYGAGWIRFETQAPNVYMSNVAPYTTLQYNNGLAAVMERVRAAHPSVYLEGSQAGGRRMDFRTARLANGDWTKDFSIDPVDSRTTQTRGLRMWPASYLNLTDAGCAPAGTYQGLGCTESGGGTGGANFDNVGDQLKVISRMPGKLSFDGYISQWPSANVAQVRAQVAAYAQVTALQDYLATFPFPDATSASWDAVAFGGAASAAGVTPAYAAAPGQALYVFRGTDPAASKTICLSTPAYGANTFTLLNGPAAGGASIADAGPCPTTSANYIPGGEQFTITLPTNSGAMFLRNVTAAPAVAAPTSVVATQNDRTVRVTWTNGSGSIAGSQISRSADNGATWSVIGTVQGAGTTYVDAEIAAGATYLYSVSAYDASIANRSSAVVSPPVGVQSAAVTTTVYDTDPAITYTGTSTLQQHVLSPASNAYATAHRITNGATATYVCSACTRLAWNSRPGAVSANGSATVTLFDSTGTVVDTRVVDTTNATVLSAREVYDSGVRPADNYRLTVTALASNTVEVDGVGVTATTPSLIDDAATPPAGDTVTYANTTAYTNLAASRGYFGNTAHSGQNPATSFSYTCADCTSIAWLSHTGPVFGSAQITLDGVNQRIVSANAASTSPTASVLYSTGPLPRGGHTLTVTNTGGNWLEVDAFQASRPQPIELNSVTHSAGEAGWSTAGFTYYTPSTAPAMTAANFYKQQSWSIRSSVTDGSVKAAYSCNSCDRLQLVTGTAPELGIVTVKVTDQTGATLASATVDEYASTRQGAHVVFDSGILPTTAGKVYTLTVTPTGTKNPNATDFWTEVQAVRTSALPVTSSYNQPPPRP